LAIDTSFNGLNSVFGVPQTAPVSGSRKSTAAGNVSSFLDDEATLSSMGSAFSMAATGSAVRSGKVASIREAISRGYQVPSSAVANKMVDFMMGLTA
jgi:flagellar biosynthesis anti-sigma factor FlgM